jgi:hypothetical protein
VHPPSLTASGSSSRLCNKNVGARPFRMLAELMYFTKLPVGQYGTAEGGAIRSDQASALHAVSFSWSAAAFGGGEMTLPRFRTREDEMKSLLLVLCISAMVAAEALPAAANGLNRSRGKELRQVASARA